MSAALLLVAPVLVDPTPLLSLEFPIDLGMGLNGAQGSWRKSAEKRKAARKTTAFRLAQYPRPPLPFVVRLTLLTAGTPDDDNVQGRCKSCRDGIADWSKVPDNDNRIRYVYAHEKVSRKLTNTVMRGIRIEMFRYAEVGT